MDTAKVTARFGDRVVGEGSPPILIAELSGNHNGDLGLAVATVEAAAEAGVDAVKLQTYTPDTLTIRSQRPEFRVPGDGPWAGRQLWDLYEEAHTPWEWHEKLFDVGRSAGIEVFSTPFDHTAVDFLENLDPPAYKIASFELVDDGLLRRVARTGRPIVASTGMATLGEISHAIEVLEAEGAEDIVLLRCTSSYPAPPADMHLRSIPALRDAVGYPVGLSDHSPGIIAPVAAVTLGACMIEKHLILDRAAGGVDSHFSLEPAEFTELVQAVRTTSDMLGRARFGVRAPESGNTMFRRSLYVVEDVEAGEALTTESVRSIRPAAGLSPRFLPDVIGRTATQDIPAGTPLTWDLITLSAD